MLFIHDFNSERMKVLALGGSMIFGDLSHERVESYAEVINGHKEKLAIVVGGGKISREFIEIARKLGADETRCDMLGIEVTRLNAMLFSLALKNCSPKVPHDFREAKMLLEIYEKIVMGGTFPGHTTDATSALLAEYLSAEQLLIATSVDGVYSEDPEKNPDARKYAELSADELVEIVSQNEVKAGSSSVVDLLASKVIQRSEIPTMIFKGTPEIIERALKGERVGTIILP